MRDGGEEKLVIEFARPYIFCLTDGDFQLFSDIEGRKVSCSVEEFDQTFTNTSKDKNILFNDSSRWMFHRYEEKWSIKRFRMSPEFGTQKQLESVLLDPIINLMVTPNIREEAYLISIFTFISEMLNIGKSEVLTEEQLSRKLMNYERAFGISAAEFQNLTNTIYGLESKEACLYLDDLSLERLISNRER